LNDWLKIRINLPSWARIKFPDWRSFLPPYSFYHSLGLAVMLGMISPLMLRVADYKRFYVFNNHYDYESYPWLFFLSVGIFITALYWITDRRQFRRDAAANAQLGLVIVLFACCLTASDFCCGRVHICMGGHMQHPPYAISEYLCDGTWAGGLIVGVALLARVHSPATAIAAVLCGFHLSFIFIFGAFRGLYPPWF
jgi:hypothetical protein